jgi:hypothetical protein
MMELQRRIEKSREQGGKKKPLRLLQGRAHSRFAGLRLDGENRALKSRTHYADVVLRSFHEQPLIDVCEPLRSGNMRIIPPQLSLAPQLGGKLRLLSSVLDCRMLH